MQCVAGGHDPSSIHSRESSVRKSSILNAAVATMVLGLAFNAQAADVTGAGASFIYPVITKWSSDYNKATGKQVNYQTIGSGGGFAQIKAGTVDFGSSDAPLKPDVLHKRSEEHTPVLHSLISISYAVFCLTPNNPYDNLSIIRTYHLISSS